MELFFFFGKTLFLQILFAFWWFLSVFSEVRLQGIYDYEFVCGKYAEIA